MTPYPGLKIDFFYKKSILQVTLMLIENYDLDFDIQGKKLAERVIKCSY